MEAEAETETGAEAEIEGKVTVRLGRGVEIDRPPVVTVTTDRRVFTAKSAVRCSRGA